MGARTAHTSTDDGSPELTTAAPGWQPPGGTSRHRVSVTADRIRPALCFRSVTRRLLTRGRIPRSIMTRAAIKTSLKSMAPIAIEVFRGIGGLDHTERTSRCDPTIEEEDRAGGRVTKRSEFPFTSRARLRFTCVRDVPWMISPCQFFVDLLC